MPAGCTRIWRRSMIENDEVKHDIFFDTNDLLGVDSDEDMA
jgi:hypothetical protein